MGVLAWFCPSLLACTYPWYDGMLHAHLEGATCACVYWCIGVCERVCEGASCELMSGRQITPTLNEDHPFLSPPSAFLLLSCLLLCCCCRSSVLNLGSTGRDLTAACSCCCFLVLCGGGAGFSVCVCAFEECVCVYIRRMRMRMRRRGARLCRPHGDTQTHIYTHAHMRFLPAVDATDDTAAARRRGTARKARRRRARRGGRREEEEEELWWCICIMMYRDAGLVGIVCMCVNLCKCVCVFRQ